MEVILSAMRGAVPHPAARRPEPPRARRLRSVAALLSLSAVFLAGSRLLAQERPGAPADTTKRVVLPPVRVTVTRDVDRSSLDLPFAISSTTPDSSRPGQPHTRLDETLMLVPGVTVSNRNNPSQDPRIAIRGYGARSAFGVRSIRILRDGMPLTLPDGQTPVDYLDLESVGKVETIRGPASALYGNAGGGVIDLRTASAPADEIAVQSRSWLGSESLQRYAGTLGGTSGRLTYQGNVGYTSSDNYRDYARQRLTNAYFRAALTARGTDFALQALGLDMPVAQNPGALTLTGLQQNPRAADSLSVVRKARKAVDQLQVGLSAERPLALPSGRGELFAQAYGGTRNLFNPLTFAVVDVGRRQYGGGARATLPFAVGALENRASVGVDVQEQNDARKNWANCNGVARTTANCQTLLVEKGVLQLDQQEIVSSYGPYVRDELRLGPANLSAGVRDDYVRFQVKDHFLSDGRDDSGARTLHALSPIFGLVVHLTPLTSLYGNVASAFETPTTTELGNRADGSGGLNLDLKPQFSTTYETGIKGTLLARIPYDAAVFDIAGRDELIPFEIPGSGGRTYYQNAGRTRRTGAELEGSTTAGPFDFAASYTYSHFRFVDFLVGTSQYAGKTIPGIPLHQAQASATWRRASGFATVEVQTRSAMYVNDANSAQAAGYGVFNARIGGFAVFGWPSLSPVIGVDNVLNRTYVGSVAVNAAGTNTTAKFYEPAPGRTWFVGLTLAGGH